MRPVLCSTSVFGVSTCVVLFLLATPAEPKAADWDAFDETTQDELHPAAQVAYFQKYHRPRSRYNHDITPASTSFVDTSQQAGETQESQRQSLTETTASKQRQSSRTAERSFNPKRWKPKNNDPKHKAPDDDGGVGGFLGEAEGLCRARRHGDFLGLGGTWKLMACDRDEGDFLLQIFGAGLYELQWRFQRRDPYWIEEVTKTLYRWIAVTLAHKWPKKWKYKADYKHGEVQPVYDRHRRKNEKQRPANFVVLTGYERGVSEKNWDERINPVGPTIKDELLGHLRMGRSHEDAPAVDMKQKEDAYLLKILPPTVRSRLFLLLMKDDFLKQADRELTKKKFDDAGGTLAEFKRDKATFLFWKVGGDFGNFLHDASDWFQEDFMMGLAQIFSVGLSVVASVLNAVGSLFASALSLGADLLRMAGKAIVGALTADTDPEGDGNKEPKFVGTDKLSAVVGRAETVHCPPQHEGTSEGTVFRDPSDILRQNHGDQEPTRDIIDQGLVSDPMMGVIQGLVQGGMWFDAYSRKEKKKAFRLYKKDFPIREKLIDDFMKFLPQDGGGASQHGVKSSEEVGDDDDEGNGNAMKAKVDRTWHDMKVFEQQTSGGTFSLKRPDLTARNSVEYENVKFSWAVQRVLKASMVRYVSLGGDKSTSLQYLLSYRRPEFQFAPWIIMAHAKRTVPVRLNATFSLDLAVLPHRLLQAAAPVLQTAHRCPGYQIEARGEQRSCRQGRACPYCGGGFCCKRGRRIGKCDGSMGGWRRYECVPKPNPNAIARTQYLTPWVEPLVTKDAAARQVATYEARLLVKLDIQVKMWSDVYSLQASDLDQAREVLKIAIGNVYAAHRAREPVASKTDGKKRNAALSEQQLAKQVYRDLSTGNRRILWLTGWSRGMRPKNSGWSRAQDRAATAVEAREGAEEEMDDLDEEDVLDEDDLGRGEGILHVDELEEGDLDGASLDQVEEDRSSKRYDPNEPGLDEEKLLVKMERYDLVMYDARNGLPKSDAFTRAIWRWARADKNRLIIGVLPERGCDYRANEYGYGCARQMASGSLLKLADVVRVAESDVRLGLGVLRDMLRFGGAGKSGEGRVKAIEEYLSGAEAPSAGAAGDVVVGAGSEKNESKAAAARRRPHLDRNKKKLAEFFPKKYKSLGAGVCWCDEPPKAVSSSSTSASLNPGDGFSGWEAERLQTTTRRCTREDFDGEEGPGVYKGSEWWRPLTHDPLESNRWPGKCSHTAFGNTHSPGYWFVQFRDGKRHKVKKLRLWNRAGCCADRLNGACVRFSLDGSKPSNADPRQSCDAYLPTKIASNSGPGSGTEVVIERSITGIMFITRSKDHVMTICGIEIYEDITASTITAPVISLASTITAPATTHSLAGPKTATRLHPGDFKGEEGPAVYKGRGGGAWWRPLTHRENDSNRWPGKCSHTDSGNEGSPGYWFVQFKDGRKHHVSKIRLWNRADCCQDRLNSACVRFSLDGSKPSNADPSQNCDDYLPPSISWKSGPGSGTEVVVGRSITGMMLITRSKDHVMTIGGIEIYEDRTAMSTTISTTRLCTWADFDGQEGPGVYKGGEWWRPLTHHEDDSNKWPGKCSHTDGGDRASPGYWFVQFKDGKKRHVTKIRLWNRADCCPDRLNSACVRFSFDGSKPSNADPSQNCDDYLPPSISSNSGPGSGTEVVVGKSITGMMFISRSKDHVMTIGGIEIYEDTALVATRTTSTTTTTTTVLFEVARRPCKVLQYVRAPEKDEGATAAIPFSPVRPGEDPCRKACDADARCLAYQGDPRARSSPTRTAIACTLYWEPPSAAYAGTYGGPHRHPFRSVPEGVAKPQGLHHYSGQQCYVHQRRIADEHSYGVGKTSRLYQAMGQGECAGCGAAGASNSSCAARVLAVDEDGVVAVAPPPADASQEGWILDEYDADGAIEGGWEGESAAAPDPLGSLLGKLKNITSVRRTAGARTVRTRSATKHRPDQLGSLQEKLSQEFQCAKACDFASELDNKHKCTGWQYVPDGVAAVVDGVGEAGRKPGAEREAPNWNCRLYVGGSRATTVIPPRMVPRKKSAFFSRFARKGKGKGIWSRPSAPRSPSSGDDARTSTAFSFCYRNATHNPDLPPLDEFECGLSVQARRYFRAGHRYLRGMRKPDWEKTCSKHSTAADSEVRDPNRDQDRPRFWGRNPATRCLVERYCTVVRPRSVSCKTFFLWWDQSGKNQSGKCPNNRDFALMRLVSPYFSETPPETKVNEVLQTSERFCSLDERFNFFGKVSAASVERDCAAVWTGESEFATDKTVVALRRAACVREAVKKQCCRPMFPSDYDGRRIAASSAVPPSRARLREPNAYGNRKGYRHLARKCWRQCGGKGGACNGFCGPDAGCARMYQKYYWHDQDHKRKRKLKERGLDQFIRRTFDGWGKDIKKSWDNGLGKELAKGWGYIAGTGKLVLPKRWESERDFDGSVGGWQDHICQIRPEPLMHLNQDCYEACKHAIGAWNTKFRGTPGSKTNYQWHEYEHVPRWQAWRGHGPCAWCGHEGVCCRRGDKHCGKDNGFHYHSCQPSLAAGGRALLDTLYATHSPVEKDSPVYAGRKRTIRGLFEWVQGIVAHAGDEKARDVFGDLSEACSVRDVFRAADDAASSSTASSSADCGIDDFVRLARGIAGWLKWRNYMCGQTALFLVKENLMRAAFHELVTVEGEAKFDRGGKKIKSTAAFAGRQYLRMKPTKVSVGTGAVSDDTDEYHDDFAPVCQDDATDGLEGVTADANDQNLLSLMQPMGTKAELFLGAASSSSASSSSASSSSAAFLEQPRKQGEADDEDVTAIAVPELSRFDRHSGRLSPEQAQQLLAAAATHRRREIDSAGATAIEGGAAVKLKSAAGGAEQSDFLQKGAEEAGAAEAELAAQHAELSAEHSLLQQTLLEHSSIHDYQTYYPQPPSSFAQTEISTSVRESATASATASSSSAAASPSASTDLSAKAISRDADATATVLRVPWLLARMSEQDDRTYPAIAYGGCPLVSLTALASMRQVGLRTLGGRNVEVNGAVGEKAQKASSASASSFAELGQGRQLAQQSPGEELLLPTAVGAAVRPAEPGPTAGDRAAILVEKKPDFDASGDLLEAPAEDEEHAVEGDEKKRAVALARVPPRQSFSSVAAKTAEKATDEDDEGDEDAARDEEFDNGDDAAWEKEACALLAPNLRLEGGNFPDGAPELRAAGDPRTTLAPRNGLLLASEFECKDKCDALPACLAFTFSVKKGDSRRCWIKGRHQQPPLKKRTFASNDPKRQIDSSGACSAALYQELSLDAKLNVGDGAHPTASRFGRTPVLTPRQWVVFPVERDLIVGSRIKNGGDESVLQLAEPPDKFVRQMGKTKNYGFACFTDGVYHSVRSARDWKPGKALQSNLNNIANLGDPRKQAKYGTGVDLDPGILVEAVTTFFTPEDATKNSLANCQHGGSKCNFCNFRSPDYNRIGVKGGGEEFKHQGICCKFGERKGACTGDFGGAGMHVCVPNIQEIITTDQDCYKDGDEECKHGGRCHLCGNGVCCRQNDANGWCEGHATFTKIGKQAWKWFSGAVAGDKAAGVFNEGAVGNCDGIIGGCGKHRCTAYQTSYEAKKNISDEVQLQKAWTVTESEKHQLAQVCALDMPATVVLDLRKHAQMARTLPGGSMMAVPGMTEVGGSSSRNKEEDKDSAFASSSSCCGEETKRAPGQVVRMKPSVELCKAHHRFPLSERTFSCCALHHKKSGGLLGGLVGSQDEAATCSYPFGIGYYDIKACLYDQPTPGGTKPPIFVQCVARELGEQLPTANSEPGQTESATAPPAETVVSWWDSLTLRLKRSQLLVQYHWWEKFELPELKKAQISGAMGAAEKSVNLLVRDLTLQPKLASDLAQSTTFQYRGDVQWAQREVETLHECWELENAILKKYFELRGKFKRRKLQEQNEAKRKKEAKEKEAAAPLHATATPMSFDALVTQRYGANPEQLPTLQQLYDDYVSLLPARGSLRKPHRGGLSVGTTVLIVVISLLLVSALVAGVLFWMGAFAATGEDEEDEDRASGAFSRFVAGARGRSGYQGSSSEEEEEGSDGGSSRSGSTQPFLILFGIKTALKTCLSFTVFATDCARLVYKVDDDAIDYVVDKLEKAAKRFLASPPKDHTQEADLQRDIAREFGSFRAEEITGRSGARPSVGDVLVFLEPFATPQQSCTPGAVFLVVASANAEAAVTSGGAVEGRAAAASSTAHEGMSLLPFRFWAEATDESESEDGAEPELQAVPLPLDLPTHHNFGKSGFLRVLAHPDQSAAETAVYRCTFGAQQGSEEQASKNVCSVFEIDVTFYKEEKNMAENLVTGVEKGISEINRGAGGFAQTMCSNFVHDFKEKATAKLKRAKALAEERASSPRKRIRGAALHPVQERGILSPRSKNVAKKFPQLFKPSGATSQEGSTRAAPPQPDPSKLVFLVEKSPAELADTESSGSESGDFTTHFFAKTQRSVLSVLRELEEMYRNSRLLRTVASLAKAVSAVKKKAARFSPGRLFARFRRRNHAEPPPNEDLRSTPGHPLSPTVNRQVAQSLFGTGVKPASFLQRLKLRKKEAVLLPQTRQTTFLQRGEDGSWFLNVNFWDWPLPTSTLVKGAAVVVTVASVGLLGPLQTIGLLPGALAGLWSLFTGSLGVTVVLGAIFKVICSVLVFMTQSIVGAGVVVGLVGALGYTITSAAAGGNKWTDEVGVSYKG
eukprot:g13318.t1